jgi:fructose-bisphosphate aldolase, class I
MNSDAGMNMQELIATTSAMVADGKGLLAMDESNPTCNKRFEKAGIPQITSQSEQI